MSRSGYTDDNDDQWALIRWRGAVKSAIRGKRGQSFLREMAAAMDAMPEKSLIAEELEHKGEVCALGSVGKARGINMANVDPEDYDGVADVFGIPNALAREIMYENDFLFYDETGEHRWQHVRKWIQEQIVT